MMEFTESYLDRLPLELRVYLMSFFKGSEKLSLGRSRDDFKTLAASHNHLAAYWDFENAFSFSARDVNDATKISKSHIRFLSLAFCTWMPASSIFPAITRCLNLTDLDLLETSVNGPTLIRILVECRQLRHLAWTVDAKKEMCRGDGVAAGARDTPARATTKADFENARRTMRGLTRIKLAGVVARSNADPASSPVLVNFKFMVGLCSKNLEALTLVAKGSLAERIDGTSAWDVLVDDSSANDVLNHCRTRLDWNMRIEDELGSLKELQFAWTGDKFGYSEVVLAGFYSNLFLRLLCYFNKQQTDRPSIKFRKLTLPSINSRLYVAFRKRFGKGSFDVSELEELTVFNFANNDRWFPHNDFGREDSVVDLDRANRLRCVRIFADALCRGDLEMGAFRGEALERLQIRCSPGIETQSLKTFNASRVDDVNSILGHCFRLTHLDVAHACVIEDQQSGTPFSRMLKRLPIQSCARLRAVVLSICAALARYDEEKSNLEKLIELAPDLEIVELIDHHYLPSVNLMPNKSFLRKSEQKTCTTMQMISRLVTSRQLTSRHRGFDQLFWHLCKLKELTSLSIASVPSPVKLAFLKEISSECLRLRHLSLSQIGKTGVCEFVAGLATALPRMENLVDLRIDHPSFPISNGSFLAGLRSCRKLERIVIFSQYESLHKQTSRLFLDSVKSLPSLYVIELFSDSSLTVCNEMTKELTAHLKPRSPGFHVLILKMFEQDSQMIVDKLNSIPVKHWMEMTTLQSRVFPGLS